MSLFLLEVVIGVAIGFTLGLLGGGGSILTVPALVYLVGQQPRVAVTASLVIVGMNSVMGAMMHRASGTLNWHVAVAFGGAGMVVSYLAAGLSKAFSPPLLMTLFAVLMVAVGIFMLTSKRNSGARQEPRGLLTVLVSGAAVGLLTGILGVGGGFLIVPALVMLVGLPMRQAVGTSLIIIAMNSLAGFMGHLNDLSLDFSMIAVFVAAGLVGTLAGTRLGRVVQPDHLRRAFAVFIIALAFALLADNVGKLLMV